MALTTLMTTEHTSRRAAPPHISLVEATPPRPSLKSSWSTDSLGALTLGSALTHTPSSGPRRHRLLYRGSLSLSDSWITLDGLTFVASAPALGGGQAELLQNPLALALESMRGRPSVHLAGMVQLDKLKDVWLDESGDVSLYIHPEATLTQTYFSNTLCLLPIPPNSQGTPYGVRIALGDPPSPGTSSTSTAGTTEVIIFGRPQPSFPFPASLSTPLRLVVARLAHGPPPSASPAGRAPRPDDPTPRKPPLLYFGAKRSSEDRAGDAPKCRKTDTNADGKAKKGKEDEEVLKRAREVMLGRPTHLGAGVRAKSTSALMNLESDTVFKVPAVPLDRKGKRKAEQDSTDVFGSEKDLFGGKVNGAAKKGKGKEKERAMSVASVGSVDGDLELPPPTPIGEVSEAEAANKLLVKRSAMRILGNRSIDKEHPEFKDIFNYVYRGASFALRAYMKAPLHPGLVEKLVDVHVRMYVDDEIPDMPSRQTT